MAKFTSLLSTNFAFPGPQANLPGAGGYQVRTKPLVVYWFIYNICNTYGF